MLFVNVPIGLVLFAAASLLGGLSTSEGQLIAARALQGLGAAILSPAALSIVTNTFAEGAERNKALGVWGAVAGGGGAAGVLLGGILTDGLGWEWVLFVNVPIALGAALLSPRLLAESRNEGRVPLDVAGAVSITAGLSLFVYTMVTANDYGWTSLHTLGLGALSVALIAGFVFIERRQQDPLVPFPGLFRIRTILGGNLAAIMTAMSLFSMFFFITLYMQNVLGFSPLKTGVAYLPLAVGIILAAGVASVLTTRLGAKRVFVGGLLLVAVALAWFSQVSPDGSYGSDVLFPSILAALGLGFSFVPMTIVAVAGVEPHEAGLASGLINTSQQVGGALGLAILSAIWTSRLDDGFAPKVASTNGMHDAFIAGSGFAVLGAILVATLVSSAAADAAAESELVPVAA